jgi:N-acetylglucosaminyl-diphospho-decaprenol L-rhamnosyltransferase
MHPCASVVILNFNGRPWLPACLDALSAQRGAPSFEVVLVDNASTDGSVALVRERWPGTRIVETGANLGYAGGNNAGARAAAGEWLVFLNNDTAPEPGWLASLAAEAAAHPGFALVTSQLVFMHDPSVIDSAGDGYFRAGSAFKHGYGASTDAWTTSREVFGACGAAFMIRRAAFDRLGGFDERFFMNFEDVDLSYRARLTGLRVWYAASAVVRHAGGGSLGAVSPAAVFYGQRNLEWAWLKNTPPEMLWRTAPQHVVYSLAGVAHYVRAGLAGPALRGKLAAIAALPAVLRDRRRVQAMRTAPAAEVAALMEPHWLAAKRREKAFQGTRRILNH